MNHPATNPPVTIITLKNGDKKRLVGRLSFNHAGIVYVYEPDSDRIKLAVAPGEWLCAEETTS